MSKSNVGRYGTNMIKQESDYKSDICEEDSGPRVAMVSGCVKMETEPGTEYAT